MNVKYGLVVEEKNLAQNLKRIINLVYKLLPMREEGGEWLKTLETIIEELVGMNNLLIDQQAKFFPVICKMEGLFSLTKEEDFPLYRRTIFECLSLLNEIKY